MSGCDNVFNLHDKYTTFLVMYIVYGFNCGSMPFIKKGLLKGPRLVFFLKTIRAN